MKEKTNHKHSYLAALQQRALVFDGAMGTNLATQQLTSQHFGGEAYLGCNDHLSLSYPRAVEHVHRAFLGVGVDVIETNTFRANRRTLGEYGLGHLVQEINLAATQLARKLADEFGSRSHPRFVAGSIGPSGRLLSIQEDSSEESFGFDAASDLFAEQASCLLQGGVDLLLLETQQDILEVKAAVHGFRAAFEKCGRRVPIQAQVTLDINGRMLPGTDIEAVLAILEGMDIEVIGLNCSTGPEHMRQPLAYLSAHSRLPISCLPNAGMPLNSADGAVYPLTPLDFADQVAAFVRDFGVNVVGGCCGTTPEHLRLLVEKLHTIPLKQRQPTIRPVLTSAFQTVSMRQEPAPFIIGERLNTQGSRAFKRIMLAEDYTAAMSIAAAQVESGAHALDICTALTEDVGEARRMGALAALLSQGINAPLVIDSTDPQVMEAALKAAPGRCLLNSVHLEGGEQKARSILQLARDYNAAVIALTIDERGMAKSAQEKLDVARRIYRLAIDEFHLQPYDLVFDPLTFTLASGSAETMDAGIQTLQAIHDIKADMPGVLTSLGVSNVSFGLNPTARAVLNSVMLYHAVQAGLDMAILNPAQLQAYSTIDQQERKLAEDLLFNRHEQALATFSVFFSGDKASSSTSSQRPALEALALDERIRQRILLRHKDGLTADLDAYIQASSAGAHASALELINGILLPAMQEIGAQFARGELILPFVLQSAEVMRAASDHLERYLEKNASASKGRLVLATVYGDVHDIGKNLVKIILANNGYEVIDLGKQVPVETIVEQAVTRQADAIGLSALLVSTSQQMPLVVEALRERQLNLPVLIGGAAVNPEFAARIQKNKEGQPYSGGVFYCADAFDALKTLETCAGLQANPQGAIWLNEEKSEESRARVLISAGKRQNSVQPAPIPQPPFWGARLWEELPMDALFTQLNRNALFRISWGVKNARGERWEKYQRDFTLKLAELRSAAEREGWLRASALYGYFPCRAQDDDLIVSNKENGISQEICFSLPRQSDGDGLCLSDYFHSSRKASLDVAAFQIVTLGQPSADYIQSLEKAGDISSAYYAHGLAVQITEAAAQFVHNHIRAELKLDARQGKRYSWGYPAIPDLSQHALLFHLLPAEEKLGLHLTSAYQFVPEYSTAALVVHHPQAAYFHIQT